MSRSLSAGAPANETIRVGCIGTGGRCRHLMQSLRTLPNVAIVAVCDVWDDALAEGAKLAAKDAFRTKDYRAVLDRKDIDAVLVGTPDHWHVPIAVAACAAGKDVYVEKPLTHSLEEGAAMLAAHRRHKRIVQVGTQQRSMPHIREAFELCREGKLGKIFRADLTWNRNLGRGSAEHKVDPKSVDWKAFVGGAPAQEFNAYKMREWRWFWDFGGGLFTDLMVHWIDVVHWLVGSEEPDAALSIGDFLHAKDKWETPDTVQTLLHYSLPNAGVLQAHYEGTFSNAFRGAMTVVMGTEATLYIDRGRYEFIPERFRPGRLDRILSKKPARRGADFYDLPDGEKLHLLDWVSAMRTRKQPSAPVEAGVAAAAAAHLANRALRAGGLAKREGKSKA
jgi:predicted dehydrogenase